jgi:hypothetical protein
MVFLGVLATTARHSKGWIHALLKMPTFWSESWRMGTSQNYRLIGKGVIDARGVRGAG